MLRSVPFPVPIALALCILSMTPVANAQYPYMPAAAMSSSGMPVPPGYGQVASPTYDLDYDSQPAGSSIVQADYLGQEAGYPVQQAACSSGYPGGSNCDGDYYGEGSLACNGCYDPYCGCGGGGGCCGPRWFDVYVNGMYLTRDNPGRKIDLISQGTPPDNIIMSTRSLNSDGAWGARITAALQIGPGAGIEGSYFDLFNWSTSASLTGVNMFSLLNGFGTDKNVGTDDATSASIAYSSGLRSAELSWKRRYCSGRGRVQSSWLLGARYIDLEEDFLLSIGTGTPDTTSYAVATSNSLVGFQTGVDSWICILPRLSVGADCKAGVYGNQTSQRTVYGTTFDSGNANFNERASDTDVALACEANLMAVVSITSRWTLRIGYQAVYLNGVTLASENINADISGTRTAVINTNGSAFYHGGTGGIEFVW